MFPLLNLSKFTLKGQRMVFWEKQDANLETPGPWFSILASSAVWLRALELFDRQFLEINSTLPPEICGVSAWLLVLGKQEKHLSISNCVHLR